VVVVLVQLWPAHLARIESAVQAPVDSHVVGGGQSDVWPLKVCVHALVFVHSG
jgi:hypothetical protein